MAWAQVNQFVVLATGVDRSANTNRSSLYNLIQLLQGINHNAGSVQAAINVIPAAKQQKYQAALTFLRNNYPGLGGGARLAGGVNLMPAGLNAQALQGARGGLGPVGAAQQAAPGVAAAPAGAVAVAGVIQPWGWINDPAPFTLVHATAQVGAFTGVQLARINEAVQRTKLAIDRAIQEISHLAAAAPGAAGPGPNTPAGRYSRFFGPLTNAPADIARKTTVLNNFQAMARVLLGARGVNASGFA